MEGRANAQQRRNSTVTHRRIWLDRLDRPTQKVPVALAVVAAVVVPSTRNGYTSHYACIYTCIYKGVAVYI